MHRKMLAVAIALMLIASLLPLATVFASGDPVVNSLNAVGFTDRQELWDFFQISSADPRELAVCPDEFACVRILREKDMFGHITPFHVINNTDVMFDGWMVGPDFRATFGRKSPPFPPESAGSGVPHVPDVFFGAWIEGITIRPFGRPPVTGAASVSTPASPTQPAPSGSFADADSVRTMFGIDASVSVTECVGESNCFNAIKRDASGNPQLFQMTNPTSHDLDGERVINGRGVAKIPAGFSGMVAGATLRP